MRWNLIVGNPPHFNGTSKEYERGRILIDPAWKIHNEFYRSLPSYLLNNGSVLFVENFKGSSPEIWKDMISKNDLNFVKSFSQKHNFLKKLRHILHLVYSLKLRDLKNAFSFYQTPQRKTKIYKKITHVLFPHYFVWSQKW